MTSADTTQVRMKRRTRQATWTSLPLSCMRKILSVCHAPGRTTVAGAITCPILRSYWRRVESAICLLIDEKRRALVVFKDRPPEL